jgi:arylsulfatase A-like enzyme
MLPTFTDKACEYIRRQAEKREPFFLYFAINSPRTPISPNKAWLGRSGLGRYADFVMETDAMVGRVMDAIEQSGIADDTLLIFTSDNGCTPAVGTTDRVGGRRVGQLEEKGHFPSAQLRGYKADVWDGGHRVPFVVRWPAVIAPGSTCGQLACQVDLMATVAEITGAEIPQTAGEDSVSLLPLFRGENRMVRESLVHHSFHGDFAIRAGRWKLVLCPGSGVWSPPPRAAKGTTLPPVQLCDMSADESETSNLQAEHPEIVRLLTATLEQIVADGRSTPGPKQRNDVPVEIAKRGRRT